MDLAVKLVRLVVEIADAPSDSDFITGLGTNNFLSAMHMDVKVKPCGN